MAAKGVTTGLGTLTLADTAGPFNAVGGEYGATAPDVGLLLTTLNWLDNAVPTIYRLGRPHRLSRRAGDVHWLPWFVHWGQSERV